MQEGRLHPLTVTIRDIAAIFGRMGFGVAYGPELEDEWHNFDALNVPADHPSRDMQDTFWTRENPSRVLRTHTSPVQIRYVEEQLKKGIEPPYRIVVPGKVFRNEATDMTHEAQFYQNEGLAIGTDITMAHLKGTLDQFFREYLGPEAKVRFRPSYFPFTEPSVEIDVWFAAGDGGKGKWLEVMGGGMVHPTVLTNMGLDPKKYQGFAFGGGIERLLMVKYGV
ncbi:MAG TPA: phenylalanine--tRNA ligase subunit alpha, partial [Candidatus Paceibacterota bacterium]